LADVVETEEELGDDENEEFAFDNVLECEELAKQLRKILNRRKFHDDGRLYKIYQVRYDEEFKTMITAG
jgi:hypothetical protein